MSTESRDSLKPLDQMTHAKKQFVLTLSLTQFKLGNCILKIIYNTNEYDSAAHQEGNWAKFSYVVLTRRLFKMPM